LNGNMVGNEEEEFIYIDARGFSVIDDAIENIKARFLYQKHREKIDRLVVEEQNRIIYQFVSIYWSKT